MPRPNNNNVVYHVVLVYQYKICIYSVKQKHRTQQRDLDFSGYSISFELRNLKLRGFKDQIFGFRLILLFVLQCFGCWRAFGSYMDRNSLNTEQSGKHFVNSLKHNNHRNFVDDMQLWRQPFFHPIGKVVAYHLFMILHFIEYWKSYFTWQFLSITTNLSNIWNKQHAANYFQLVYPSI